MHMNEYMHACTHSYEHTHTHTHTWLKAPFCAKNTLQKMKKGEMNEFSELKTSWNFCSDHYQKNNFSWSLLKLRKEVLSTYKFFAANYMSVIIIAGLSSWMPLFTTFFQPIKALSYFLLLILTHT